MENRIQSFNECWNESRQRVKDTHDLLAVAKCLEKYRDQLKWPGTDIDVPNTVRRLVSMPFFRGRMRDRVPWWGKRWLCCLPLHQAEADVTRLRWLHVQALYLLYACDKLPVEDEAGKNIFFRATLKVNWNVTLFTVYENGLIEWKGTSAAASPENISPRDPSVHGSAWSLGSVDMMGSDCGYLSPRSKVDTPQLRASTPFSVEVLDAPR